MHVYRYKHMQYTSTHVHAPTHTCLDRHTHTCTFTYTQCTHTHTHTHTHIHVRMRTWIHIHTLAHATHFWDTPDHPPEEEDTGEDLKAGQHGVRLHQPHSAVQDLDRKTAKQASERSPKQQENGHTSSTENKIRSNVCM